MLQIFRKLNAVLLITARLKLHLCYMTLHFQSNAI